MVLVISGRNLIYIQTITDMFYRNSQFSLLSSENTKEMQQKYGFSSAAKLAQIISSCPNNILQNFNHP